MKSYEVLVGEKVVTIQRQENGTFMWPTSLQQWSPYGTALKPSVEPIVVAMKPLDGTFAQNAEKWGVAGINVDGGRIATSETLSIGSGKIGKNTFGEYAHDNPGQQHAQGRWPANLILDEEAGKMLDEQTGELKSGALNSGHRQGSGMFMNNDGKTILRNYGNDSGGASRFFKNIQESDIEWLDRNLLPGLVNSVDNHISLQNRSVVSALSDAVTRALPEASQLSVLTLPSMPVMPTELRRLVMSSIETIPFFVQRFSQEPPPESIVEQLGPVKLAAAREQTGTMIVTVSHWRSDGSADPAILSITLPSLDRGEKALRFNYCAKSSASERNAGCDELPEIQTTDGNIRTNPDTARKYQANSVPRKNSHPTVKPLKLMEYLCTLTKTPTGGIVLDPFSGSGTTLLAAKNTGREYIGIEQNPEYFAIIKARLGLI